MKHLLSAILIVFIGLCTSTAQEFSARYELVNLGRKVNTGYHEGAPVISADGKTLYFFVHNHPENNYGREGSQDIWFADMDEEGQWGEAQHLGKPLNQHRSNQVFTVLPNQTLFIRGGSSKNSKGFSFTRKEGSSWNSPNEIKVEEFKKMNLGKFYGATISSDAAVMVLHFSEKENSVFSDLYISKKVDNKNWTVPVKLGANLNTSRDEFAPFLAPDDKTLYFSSNRKDMGYGKSDIYKTTRLDDTWMKWSDPVNVGKPLNTSAFDAYMSVDAAGNVFTTQSGNTIDGGNLDIFWLLPKDINITLKGLIADKKTSEGLRATVVVLQNNTPVDTLNLTNGNGAYTTKLGGEGKFELRVSALDYHPASAGFTLFDVFNDTTLIKDVFLNQIKKNAILTGTVYDGKTDEPIAAAKLNIASNSIGNAENLKHLNGYFETELIEYGWYTLTASAEGYINTSDSVEYIEGGDLLMGKDIYLSLIEVGATVRLDNIFFDFDKATLKSESFVELDKVVEFLQDNETVEIEIAGHTDSKGADDYNLKLSQGRAEAVVNYIIKHGINRSRLTAHGYGETVPLETNDTDQGRAVNRRVEFTVVKK